MTDREWMLTEEDSWRTDPNGYTSLLNRAELALAAQRRLVEWQSQRCTQHVQLHKPHSIQWRRECWRCMEQLRKEVEVANESV